MFTHVLIFFLCNLFLAKSSRNYFKNENEKIISLNGLYTAVVQLNYILVYNNIDNDLIGNYVMGDNFRLENNGEIFYDDNDCFEFNSKILVGKFLEIK